MSRRAHHLRPAGRPLQPVGQPALIVERQRADLVQDQRAETRDWRKHQPLPWAPARDELVAADQEQFENVLHDAGTVHE